MVLQACPECGAQVSSEAASCPSCGVALEASAVERSWRPSDPLVLGGLIESPFLRSVLAVVFFVLMLVMVC